MNLRDVIEMLAVSEPLRRAIGTVAVLAFLLGLRALASRIVRGRTRDLDTRLLWRQVVSYTLFILAVMLVAWIWFDGIGSVLTVFSLIAAALTIVNKELFLNLTGWSVVVWRQLFIVGDRVQIGAHTGIVMDMGPLYMTLVETLPDSDQDQVTGRQVKVPNALVLSQPVINETGVSHVTWNELTLCVTVGSDWKKASDLFEETVRKEAGRYGDKERDPGRIDAVLSGKAFVPVVFVEVRDSKVQLTSRYPCPTLQRRRSRSRVWTELLEAYRNQEDIVLC